MVAYVDALAAEADTHLWRQSCERAKRNDELFVGDHWDSWGEENEARIAINRLQNAVLSTAAIQGEEPPKVQHVPMENLEPPTYFINTKLDTPATPELQALLAALPPETYQPGPNGEAPRALTSEEVARIEQAILASQQMAAMNPGMPQGIPSDVLIGVNDRVAAEALTTIYDAMMNRCRMRKVVRENMLNNLKFGWQPLLYEWDDEKQMPRLTNVHFKHVRIDQNATDTSDASYVIYYQFIDEHKAKSLYPDLALKIEVAAQTGTIGTSDEIGERYASMNYARKMVCIKTAWIRNVPFVLTEEEALAEGRVTQRVREERKPVACNCGMGDAYEAIDEHAVDCPKRVAYEGAVAAVIASGGDAATAVPPTEIVEQIEEYVNEKGEVCEPMGDGWPVRYGIAQARIIADELVDYRECEFADIPIAWNVNIPYSYCPFGQGEPERLEPIQMAIDRVMTSITTQYDFASQPVEAMPQSINEMLPEFAQKAYSYKPGAKWIVPDHLIQQFGGKLTFTQDPPKIPTDAWRMVELLIRLMDEESGHNEVLQGRAASSWSGEAISTLQRAAKGIIGWKSAGIEDMLAYLTRLVDHDIIHRMSDDEKLRYVSKYPVQVWYAIAQRMKSLDVDITIEIASGSGAAKQGQRATDLSLFDRKLISPQTTLERAGFDPKVEINNWRTWNAVSRDAGGPQPAAEVPQETANQAEAPVVGATA